MKIPWDNGKILWDEAAQDPMIHALASCPQEPEFHAEGDVLIHTKMVVEAAMEEARQAGLGREETRTLALAALWHDVGKPLTLEKSERGWSSPKHARAGTYALREALWRANNPLKLQEREALLQLVLRHAWPARFLERENPEASLIKVSLVGSNKLLGLLARADNNGRICRDKVRQRQCMEECGLWLDRAKELECLESPYKFHNEESRIAWLRKGEGTGAGIQMPSKARFTVTMLSGLPGSGKDHWLQKNHHGPVISRDAIRFKLASKGDKDEGHVVQEFAALTKEALAKKEDFALNATFLQMERRGGFLNLIHAYGGRTRIVYLEAGRETLLARIKEREARGGHTVPTSAVDRLAKKMEPPTLLECEELVLEQGPEKSKVRTSKKLGTRIVL
jgi:predicted kinase